MIAIHAWLLGAGLVLTAQDEVADSVCLMCHDAVSTPAGSPTGAGGAMKIHAQVACIDCHAALRAFDVEELEHALPVPAADCTSCHAEVAQHLQGSAHLEAGVGCSSCHGSHDLRAFHEADRALVSGRVNALCARCHSDVIVAFPGDVHAKGFDGRSCLACHDAHAARPPPAAEADRTCLMCHDEDPVDGASGAAPPSTAAASVHGAAGVSCVLCHADLRDAELPHEDELARVSCGSCHAAAADAHTRGVHGGTLGNGHVAAACTDCHGTHDVRGSEDPRSPTSPRRLPLTCEVCHRPSPPEEHPAPGGERVRIYESSIHGRLLLEQGLVVSATCSSCHGSHEIHPIDDPDAATSRRHVPYTCGACHAGVLEGYLRGVHGSDFLTGVEDVPVCTDCHSEHAIEDPALDTSSVSDDLIAQTCARCHADEALAQSYGLAGTQLRSWGRSYHGIARALGDERAANCASCHGFHEIYASSDPRSSIHPDNLQATCGGCHGSAGAAFSRVPVHSEIDAQTNPIAWWVRGIYLFLITATIGAFVLFILIDLFGLIRLRIGWGTLGEDPIDPHWRARENELIGPAETFPRLSVQARIQHGILIVAFLLLVLTGVPLFLHELPLMSSVVGLEGGFRLRGQLHRAAAFGLIGLSVWHVVVILLHPAGRRWFLSMLIRPRDVRDFLQDSLFSLGITAWLSRRNWLRAFFERHPGWAGKTRPRLGRYGLVEKLEYIAVLWGNAVMIASGAVLWRPDWFLPVVPIWAFDLCRVVHGYEATLAFLAIIIWHMYHVHLKPGVFPMNSAWLTGRISREELRHHHPQEYTAILQRRAARRMSAESESTRP